jgi:hypothetical protein
MKKPFLQEFRGKARWRKHRVFISAFLIMFLYDQIGKVNWCFGIAEKIPFGWKCFTFLVLFSLIWYADWKIYRRVLDTTRPPPHAFFFVLIGVVAFAFAIITADQRAFFNGCTLLWIFLLYANERYFWHKREKLKEKNSDEAIDPQ